MGIGYFLAFYLNVFITEYLYLAPLQSLTERLSTGYFRIEIWKHLLYSIKQQPWFGYGWFQTNIAQLQGVLLFKNEGYLSSAHNIAIDIILWTGVPIGLLITVYTFFLLKSLFLNITTLSDFYIFTLITCILVHANFEFPLYYSYFLFPFGFSIGLLLINLKSKNHHLNKNTQSIIFLLSIFTYATIFKHYDQWQSNLGYAAGMENTGIFKKHNSLIFSQFSAQEKFLISKYNHQYKKNEILEFQHYVDSQPSYFNLFKMSKILYHNHDFYKAKYYLEISNSIYKKNNKFEEICIKNDSQDGKITVSYLQSTKLKPNTIE